LQRPPLDTQVRAYMP